MNTAQLPLHDIADAPTVGWWPLAWGWWVLLIVTVLAISILVIGLRRRYQRLRARKAAEQRLQLPLPSLSDVNLIIKQTALAYFPREQIAALHGQAWLSFLQATMPLKHRAQFSAQLEPWLTQLYSPQEGVDVAAYQKLMQLWVRHALPPASKGERNV